MQKINIIHIVKEDTFFKLEELEVNNNSPQSTNYSSQSGLVDVKVISNGYF